MHAAPTRPPTWLPQRPDELAELCALFQREAVRSYLEVGCRYGGSLEVIARHLPAGARIVGVDLPGGPWGKNDSEPHLRAVVDDLRRDGYDAELILGHSRSPGVLQMVRARAPFDAVLIDADHQLDAVRADWEAYGPLARLVVFHDIDAYDRHSNGRWIGVPQLWEELRERFEAREIIGAERGMGIGVLFRDRPKAGWG
jgi:predicted O-methyltransferase YrrM